MSGSGDHYVEEGLHLFAQGEMVRALSLWRKALNLSPNDSQVAAIIRHVETHYLGASSAAQGSDAHPSLAAGEESPGEAFERLEETAPGQIPETDPGIAMSTEALRTQHRVQLDEALREAGDDVDRLLERMMALNQEGNSEGALSLAEEVLKRDPKRKAAQDYRERARGLLLQGYLQELGDLSRIPRISARAFEMDWSRVEGHPQAMLVQIDGRTPLEDLIMLGGIPRFEAARTLTSMQRAGALVIDEVLE